jgi:hypothetical protein
MKESELFGFMLNPSLFPLLKNNITSVLLAYPKKDDPLRLAIESLNEIDCIENISEDLIDIKLSKNGINGIIRDDILLTYKKSTTMNVEEFAAILEWFKGFVGKQLIKDILSKKGNDPLEAIRAIKEIEITDEESILNNIEVYSECDFDGIDVKKVDEDIGEVFRSSFSLINDNTPKSGYFAGQLVAVVGPPSGGKSIFLMNEAVNFIRQGKKVLYSAIGDLNQFDFINRIAGIITDTNLTQVAMDLPYYYAAATKSLPLMKNLKIQFIAPDKITVHEYVNILKKKGLYDDIDVFIIDYDSNFASSIDSMYEKGEEVYTEAVTLAKRPGKLVLMGCQPKINYWADEILELNSLSESSRKQHIIDMMISLSHPATPNGANHVGVMNICKNRRGSKGSSPYFLDKTGFMFNINRDDYNYLKKELQPITFSSNPVGGAKQCNQGIGNLAQSALSNSSGDTSNLITRSDDLTALSSELVNSFNGSIQNDLNIGNN